MNRKRRRLLGLFAASLLVAQPLQAASAIEISAFNLEASSDGEGTVANASFALLLPPAIEEVINRGVSVYFLMQLEITRPRWYWRDERLLQVERTYVVSYNALTRQYRLTFQNYRQSFANLTDALLAMVRVRGWKVAERDQLRRGDTYEAQIRMKLDLSQMPKPFQINAFTNRDWTLGTEWKSVQYSP
jgi:Domain of unknown function (DUF4390)